MLYDTAARVKLPEAVLSAGSSKSLRSEEETPFVSLPGHPEQSCVLLSEAWTVMCPLTSHTDLLTCGVPHELHSSGMPLCFFGSDPSVLQACDITGGLYLKVPQMPSLLQYLLVSEQQHSHFLPREGITGVNGGFRVPGLRGPTFGSLNSGGCLQMSYDYIAWA